MADAESKQAQELHDKRQDYDGAAKPVDHQSGVAFYVASIVDSTEREKKNPKEITVSKVPGACEVVFGKEKLILDAEGVKNAVRVFSDLSLDL